jgi:outer membrane protein assembly factor BamB/tetratricopeptide (TPR) repeat protein
MSWSIRRAVLILMAVGTLGSVALLAHAYEQVEVKGGGLVVRPRPPRPGTGTDANPDDFSTALKLPEKSEMAGKLEAGQDYIDQRKWEVAIPHLQNLLNQTGKNEDVFATITRTDADGKKTKVMVSVFAETNRLLGSMPKEGKDSYEKAFGPNARDMLKDAKENGDPELLARVMRYYLYTQAGAEATNLLGTYHLDRGNFVAADLCFGKLLDSGAIDNMPPSTLFKAAYAANMAARGSTKSSPNEDLAWKKLNLRGGSLTVHGEKKNVAELQDYVAQLTRADANLNANENPMVGINPSRNAQGEGGPAFMATIWKNRTFTSDNTKERFVDKAMDALNSRGGKPAILPASFPITAISEVKDKQTGLMKPTGLLIYRSYNGVEAVNIKGGGLVWESPSAFSLDALVKAGASNNIAIMNQWVDYYINLQHANQFGLPGGARPSILFENSALGSLTTDGNLVYAVEDVAVPPPPHVVMYPQSYPNALGKVNPDHNVLKALSLTRQGSEEWELGSKDSELSGCFFLGAPLPMGGKLYALVEKDQDLRLVCIDPTGAKKDKNFKPVIVSSQTLASTRDKLQADVVRRIQAVHLAYGEGVLICPTNAGAVFGVDLLTNSLLWAYPYREKSEAAPDPIQPGMPGWRGKGGFGPGFGPGGPIGSIAPTGWRVTPPVIQDGKVVFAAPDSGALHCVNLRDGTPVWTQKRKEEDLYLAGVFAGKVVVVGKNRVRAYKLANGEPAWDGKELETGIPSGHGIASNNKYYLPLRDAATDHLPEICEIDVVKGEITAHTKSRQKVEDKDKEEKTDGSLLVPGNLLFFEGQVLSQSKTHVFAFPQLKTKTEQMKNDLAKNPNDPKGLTELGELLLDEGRLEESIENLNKALANIKDDTDKAVTRKARMTLYDTLTHYVQKNFEKAEPYLKTYEALCTVTTEDIPDEAKATAESRRRRANFLCLVAKGKEDQGKLYEAFERYQEFGKLGGAGELLSVIDEPTVKASPAVWSQGRIAAMVAKATPEQRKPLEERITKEWEELKKNGNLDDVRKFVGVFGSLFPVGKEARLHLAQRLIKESKDGNAPALLDAERHLNLLRSSKENPELAARAVEALAQLCLSKDLDDDAAFHFRTLRDQYGKVKVRDGKTGADLFDELASDQRYYGLLEEAAKLPPITKDDPKVKEERGNFPYTIQSYTFAQDGEALPFFRRHRISLRHDFHQVKVTDRFDREGKDRWAENLTPRTQFQNIVQQWQNFFGNQSMPQFSYMNMGHLVVLPVGNMVFGLDPVNKKVLWKKDVSTPTGVPNANPPQWQWNGQNLMVDPRDGSVVITYLDGWTQRLGGTGPLHGTTVTLQMRDALEAIDPISGQTLWRRTDLIGNYHVFGDDQYVCVVEEGTNGATSSKLLRAYDGVTVKDARDFAAAYEKRLRVIGRNILVSDNNAKNGTTLRLYDVVEGKDLWKQTFAAGATMLRSEDPNLAGAVEPDGKIRVYDLRTQEEVLNNKAINPKDLKDVQGLSLIADHEYLYVAVNGPPDAKMAQGGGGVYSNLWPGTGMRTIPVNGTVYCFARGAATPSWYMDVPNNMMVLEQFRDMPMVLFTARYNKLINIGGGMQWQNIGTALAIDKKSGKRIYAPDNLMQNLQFHTLNVDSKNNKIDFIGQQMKVSFLLQSAPNSANPSGAKKESETPKPVTPEEIRKQKEQEKLDELRKLDELKRERLRERQQQLKEVDEDGFLVDQLRQLMELQEAERRNIDRIKR